MIVFETEKHPQAWGRRVDSRRVWFLAKELRSRLMGLAQWGLGEPRNSTGVLWLVRATASGQLMCVLVIGGTGARQGEASF